jgi:dolichol-phosphate mannosyltransferase
MTDLTVVVPVFNEEAGLPIFHARLTKSIAQLALNVNIIYVNDGSTDNTQAVLDNIVDSDARVTSLELSRNFGHQAALSAGLERADGRLVVMLDGDGQHPPELITEMLRLQALGYDIVQAQRDDSQSSASFLKKRTAVLFYWLLRNLGEIDVPPGCADFRLVSQDVVQALRSLPEYHRFLRGMVSWLGFKTIILPYRPEGRLRGDSKYSIRKMLRLATDGVFSFSLLPLRLGLVLGCSFLVLGLGEIAYIMSFWLSGRQGELVRGWTSLVVLLTFSSGAIMILLGFIGTYVGMIFQEVKRRPVFIVRSTRESTVESNVRDEHEIIARRGA